ncbi:hypothetical protein GCM10025859_03650 [Alicyclobacillus fastidiosus]|nr:hypothetical protein GCM10025859_03650 [Alicyclobacillus fastidiosus]
MHAPFASIWGRESELSEEQFEYTVKWYQEYAHRAQENGYMIGPENHWGASRVPANIKKIYEAVDNPSFGILLHFENWDTDEENGDRLCAPYAFHTHLAAWVEPRYEDKLKILADTGYSGYLGVEHHSGENEYIQVEWQLASLRRTASQLARSKTQMGVNSDESCSGGGYWHRLNWETSLGELREN